MQDLYGKLKEYGESDYYPYHMPGHKRRLSGEMPKEYISADITEIDGFDNLHDAKEILRTLQTEAAKMYGAEESYYLVNGSSCGVLGAISAAVTEGGHIIMARNAHKSAYHGAYLRKLKISYIYPNQVEGYEINEACSVEQVKLALEENPEAQAVFIVSPTYEGRIANVAEIAKLVHEQNKILIVDEAHGAHLGFAEGFVKNSNQAGADLVIHSVHKTLPAPTQTALLHVNGSRVNRDLLKRFLHIYQSSSPSYLLMAGIADAMRLVKTQGDRLFADFRKRWEAMLSELKQCENLRFLPIDFPQNHDIGKLVIDIGKMDEFGTGKSGLWLYDVLREKYHLQLEMAAGNYCLAMFTIGDTEEGFRRMQEALLQIDKKLTWESESGALSKEKKTKSIENHDFETENQKIAGSISSEKNYGLEERILGEISGYEEKNFDDDLSGKNSVWGMRLNYRAEVAYPFYQAWDMFKKKVRLEDCLGKIAGEFINLYPPGTPILVPGERISKEKLELIKDYIKKGLNVQGVEQYMEERYVYCIE